MESLAKCISKEGLLQSLRNLTWRTDVKLIKDPEIGRATKGMEGSTSLVTRVKVFYSFLRENTERCEVFVVKACPLNSYQLDIVKRCQLFKREGTYFKEVVPLMLKATKGKFKIPLPICYHADYDGVCDAIYLEDLSEMGFKTPDNSFLINGLDYPHCNLAMKTIGRLHAFTIAAEKLLPPLYKDWLDAFPIFFRDGLFYQEEPGEPPSPICGVVETAIGNIMNMSKELDGLPKTVEASGALRKVMNNYWKTICKLVKPDPRGRNVLTHGDCWMNNFMFRYVGDTPSGAKFIDLQISRYCNPSIELLYFFHMGTLKGFRDKHMDSLVSVYYKYLAETLNELEYGPPPMTLEGLKSDLNGRYKIFGVILGTIFTPVMWLGEDFLPKDIADMTPEMMLEIFKTGNAPAISAKFSRDPIYRSKMEDIVREFVDVAFPGGADSIASSPLA